MPPGAPQPSGELPHPGAMPAPGGVAPPQPGFLPPAGTPAPAPGGGGITVNYGGMYSGKRNTEAVGSLTASLVGLVLMCTILAPVIGGVVAILLALKAKRTIAASNGAESGDGMATAGLVIGIIDLALIALTGLAIIGAITKAISGQPQP
jgi:hypothetical protein